MTPTAKLDRRYSNATAAPISWPTAQQRLADAEVAWLVTVRADGRPHATPLVPVWHADRVYFQTGEGTEQKYVNLQTNPHVLVLAGDSRWDEGMDLVVEGVARQITDRDLLEAIAERYARRWDGRWRLDVSDAGFTNPATGNHPSVLFEVTPVTAFAHAKGDPFGRAGPTLGDGRNGGHRSPRSVKRCRFGAAF